MLNKYLPDKAIDIIDEACARKSTMSHKLENNDHYKVFEQKLEHLNKQLEQAIARQDYFTAAELKDQEDAIKIEIQKVRLQSSLPKHLRTTIDIHDIGQVISDKIGIPHNLITESETTKLLRLEHDLKKKIIGQDEAVKAIVTSIKRNRLSPIIKHRPIASFLFLGPSGVGKTYLAKLIAQDYF
jgi:ATP-dependent Clp protease ATP-binding subunit ClpC